MTGTGWAEIKFRQARDADRTAEVAAGIGEYAIANEAYRLAGILRRQAREIRESEAASDARQARTGLQQPLVEGRMEPIDMSLKDPE